MTTESVTVLHNRAMAAAEAALLARFRRDRDQELTALQQAFELEREAAETGNRLGIGEPSRSILLRSAATLAYDVGELDEAERLAHVAMAGSPPEFVKQELRGLLQNTNASQHLKVTGVTLQPGDFQFVIDGPAVGHGFIPYELYDERVRALQATLFRTGERLQQRPYRSRGARPKSVKQELPILLSVPRAASFAITFRVGSTEATLFPEQTLAVRAAKEVVKNIKLVGEGEMDALEAAIPDIAYRRSFIANAKALAPDGERVTGVGFTLPDEFGEKPYMLKRTADELGAALPDLPQKPDGPPSNVLRIVTGTLLAVDDRSGKGEISLEPDGGGAFITIKVPEGLDDIVDLMWRKVVRVSGYQRDKLLELVDIDSVQ